MEDVVLVQLLLLGLGYGHDGVHEVLRLVVVGLEELGGELEEREDEGKEELLAALREKWLHCWLFEAGRGKFEGCLG